MIDINNFKKGKSMKNFKFKILMVILFIVLALCISVLTKMFFDYIQIKEIGEKYTKIFFTNWSVRILTQVISFVIIYILVMCSFFIARKNLLYTNVKSEFLRKRIPLLLLCIVISFMIGSIVSRSLYSKFLLFINPEWFGKGDPIFNIDIGYYVFQRPFLISITETSLTVWLFIFLTSLGIYVFFGSVIGGISIKQLISEKPFLVHNIVNIAILLLINCTTYKFKAEEILYGTFGDLKGAGYTDINVWLKYYRMVPYVLVLLVGISIFFILRRKFKNSVFTLLVFPCFWVVALLFSFVVQVMVVAPNEVLMENKYISYNIGYTQASYGIDNLTETDFSVDNNLNLDMVRKNKDVIGNIRILDLPSNLTVLNQIQGIRNYYKFNETDIVPYDINGGKTAAAITPREVFKDNLSDSANTYINKKLRYTHGFGVVMNVINKVSAQGQPEFLIKDIPPKSAEGVQSIVQPRIYYGELTDDYVIVNNTKYKELDYSEGQEDIEFTYGGKSGLNLNFFNRVVFAVKYGDFRLLISDLVTKDSKILINRNIVNRLKMVAPFLQYDTDPYMVIDNEGRLKWVVDAYTTTSYYPYAQSYGDFNYIRNSVKAVVDAYDGTVDFYIIDNQDPIIKVYSKIYPTLFSKDEVPDSIKEHDKYPEYLFKIQANIYGKYHVSNPTAFYNKNDLWVIAKEKYGVTSEEREVQPYYNMMKLKDGSDELLLTIPYTLSNKDNMVAWLAVKNEWDDYGKLSIYKFPKDINIYGPMQIENRINSDTEISKALALWSQGGSKVIRGNMIVVPVENSILYVEPLYMTSNNQSNLPELKQVIVAYGEKIIMRDTLEEAIYALFDAKVPTQLQDTNTIVDLTANELMNKVVLEFKNVQKASSENNWEEYGKSMKALEDTIKELEKSQQNTITGENETNQQNNSQNIDENSVLNTNSPE